MFSKLSRILIGGATIALLAGGAWASGSHKQEEKKKETTEPSFMVKGTQKVCPIRKKKIVPDAHVDYQGQRIYFCCPGCDKKFLESPETYFSEMKERGEIAESIQKICPVSGDELEDHDISVTLAGRKIYFCCKDCVKKFKKNKSKYLPRMSGKHDEEKEDHDGHGDHHKKKKGSQKHGGHDHSSHQH